MAQAAAKHSPSMLAYLASAGRRNLLPANTRPQPSGQHDGDISSH